MKHALAIFAIFALCGCDNPVVEQIVDQTGSPAPDREPATNPDADAPDDQSAVLTPEQLTAIWNPIPIGGAPLCGNGVVDDGEHCDYSEPAGQFSIGNGTPGSYCSAGCLWRCRWIGASARPADGQLCVNPLMRMQCVAAARCTKTIEDEITQRSFGECVAEARCQADGRDDCANPGLDTTVAGCQQWRDRDLVENQNDLNRHEAICNAYVGC